MWRLTTLFYARGKSSDIVSCSKGRVCGMFLAYSRTSRARPERFGDMLQFLLAKTLLVQEGGVSDSDLRDGLVERRSRGVAELS